MSEKLKKSSSFINFQRALKNLERALATPVAEPRDLSGIIKDFEMVYELSWKVLKKILLDAGHQTMGAKDVYTKAYQLGYLEEEKLWLNIIEDRNKAAHVYDEKSARKIVEDIKMYYLPAFLVLLKKIK